MWKTVHTGLLVAGLLVTAQAQPAYISVMVTDAETAELTPARIRITDAGGQIPPAPDAAIAVMYGHWDHADGYEFQPDSSFYVNGMFSAELAPGEYSIEISKGTEFLKQRHSVVLQPADSVSVSFALERWFNSPSAGWYSADDHIHIRRSPREDSLILSWVEAEDINVGILLWMGDFWETYYAQYAFGTDGVYQRGHHLIASGQEEPRTPELGHAIGIGADEKVRYRDEYYYYDKVFDRIRELGGVAGYAHQAETFHGYRGLTLDGLRGKLDMLEILQFCAPGGPLIVDHYYHMLDLGFKLTAVAGSDFPWCGMGRHYGVEDAPDDPAQIGNVRFYTFTGEDFTYDLWKEGLKSGRTFVSSGPIVHLEVNGEKPGGELDLPRGSNVSITARAFGHHEQIPLSNLRIVSHGEVIASVSASDDGQSRDSLAIELSLPAGQGMWIAATAEAGRLQVAHTTPVYLRVDGGGFHNSQTASHYLDLNEKYLRALEHELENPGEELDRQAWRYKEGLEERIAETRAVILKLRERLK